MPHSVPCNACGAEFSISDDLFARKVAGRVVTVECRNCHTPIHIDGTHGRAAVLKNVELPTMPSASRDPRRSSESTPDPAPELLVQMPDRVGLLAGTRMPLTSPAPSAARENPGAAELMESRSAAVGALWVVSDRDDVDHELSYEALGVAVRNGQFDRKSIAWREGMAEWLPLGRIDELSALFAPEGLGPTARSRSTSNLSGSTMLGIGQPPNPVAGAANLTVRAGATPAKQANPAVQRSPLGGAGIRTPIANTPTASSVTPAPTVPIVAVPRPDRGANPNRAPSFPELAASGARASSQAQRGTGSPDANKAGLGAQRDARAASAFSPTSAAVMEDGEVEPLPPSTAQAAMQALGQVTLADTSEALPPSSAAAALEALSETLLDEDVHSVHNPAVVDEETIPLETLLDDEVESLHDPLSGHGSAAQASAHNPFAGDEDTTSSSRQDPASGAGGLLDAIEDDPPEPRRMRANPLESTPPSSIPGLYPRRSRTGVWLALAAVLAAGAGGWYLFGRGISPFEQDVAAPNEEPAKTSVTPRPAPNLAADTAAVAQDKTGAAHTDDADTAREPEVRPVTEVQSAEAAGTARAATGEPHTRRGRKNSRQNEEASLDAPPPEEHAAPPAGPEAVAAAPAETPSTPDPATKVAPPFDKASAQSALAAAAAVAAGCRKEGDPVGSTNVTVTLAPSGRATAANVVGPFGGTRVGGCIAQRMRAVRVPAFSGPHVTLQKTVVLR